MPKASPLQLWTRVGLAVVALALGLVPLACSDDQRALPGGSAAGGVGNAPSVGPCSEGATQKCGVTLGEHDGVLTCYVGTQSCEKGVWSTCSNGEVVNKSASKSKGPTSGTQAFGPPSPCANNPCDPYCQNYDEAPDGGLQPEAGVNYSWPTGSLGQLPGGLVNKGLKEPCRSGADCQFNSYCKEPQTASSCTHSKCQTGAGLTSTCDPCVGMVCATNPTCCTASFSGTCGHSPCSTGWRLKKYCDPCVTQICNTAGLSYCCQKGNPWNAACVAAVNTVCGKSCASNWDNTCVGAVKSVCDAQCGSGAPPPESAQCEPWLPGQTDPSCSGV
ncbi:MAG: hypothetical protein R3B13_31130, partial [Polyangiaceae bacterium]